MLTRLRARHPRIFQLVAITAALSLLFGAGTPAFAITPAGTIIQPAAATITGTGAGGETLTGTSGVPAAVTVKDVYGLAWEVTPADASVQPSGTAMYRYRFRSNGNSPAATASATVYFSATGTWVQGVYLDAAGAQPATSAASLQPNPANATYAGAYSPASNSASELDFYVKVTAPAGTPSGSAAMTVTVENAGYRAAGANDAFDGADRLTHSALTSISAAEASIAAPAENASVTGQAAVTGAAAGGGFSKYSLHYGPGTSPTVWGVVTATSTTPVASGGTLGSWNTSNLDGWYTLRLIVEDTAGNKLTADRRVKVDNAYTLSGTLPVGQWTMVSFPGQPVEIQPAQIFGNSRYETQWWDPTVAQPDSYMYNYKRSFTIENAGFAFWVKPYDQDIAWSVSAWAPDTTTDFSLDLHSGWNQIGAPFNRSVSWSYFEVKNTATGQTKTMTDAVAASWIGSSFYAYRNGAYVALGASDSLTPYEGYFVRSYIDGELLLDPGAGRPGGLAKLVGPKNVYVWQAKISAVGASAKDTDNTAAIAREGARGFDPMDSGEPPTVRPYVSVYFPHDDWERYAGRFARDVRGLEDAGSGTTETSWTFVVESSEIEEIALSVPNAAELPDTYAFTVKDAETGAEFDPKTEDYKYTDADGSREFLLTARKVGAVAETELAVDLPAGWSMISAPLKPETTDVRDQLGDDLSRISVFQYYDREMFNPGSPERVDIQAGVGYWINLDAAQRVDFKGAPTNPAEAVEVELVTGWNLIGNPFEQDMAFGDNIRVRYEGEEIALGDAIARGWLVEPMYTYMNATGGYVAVNRGGTLETWRGYAVKSLVKCALLLKP